MSDEAERQQAALRAFVRAGEHHRRLYGQEWGDPTRSPMLTAVLARFLTPFLAPTATVLEIGTGGGRWTREMVGRAGRLILVDAVPEFESAVREQLPDIEATFLVSPDGRLPGVESAVADLAFSFDTFVHFGPALFDRYVETVGRVLRPGGHFALHHARAHAECASGAGCFQYREEAEVDGLLVRCGLRPVDALALPHGFGSRVVMARKVASGSTP